MEEIKQPVEIHKPDMPFADKVKKMSKSNLLGEARRIANRKGSLIDGAYAIALVLTQFDGAQMGGDDPYCRHQRGKRRVAGTGGLILR